MAPELLEPDSERKMVLIRTAQEALTNAQKHSAATRIELSLEQTDECYLLVCRTMAVVQRGRSRVLDLVSVWGIFQRACGGFGGVVELSPGSDGGAVLLLTLPRGGAQ